MQSLLELGGTVSAHTAQQRTIGQFFWKHPAIVFTMLYVYTSGVGVIYTWSLFRSFRINVMDFAEANDFLLAAFREPAASVQSFFYMVALVWFGAGAIEAYRRVTTGLSRPGTTVAMFVISTRRAISRTGLVVILIGGTVGPPLVMGSWDGKRIKSGQGQRVAVERRSAGEQASRSCWDGGLLLIGTTEKFTFFYDLQDEYTHILPTSNILHIHHFTEHSTWVCPAPTPSAQQQLGKP